MGSFGPPFLSVVLNSIDSTIVLGTVQNVGLSWYGLNCRRTLKRIVIINWKHFSLAVVEMTLKKNQWEP